MFYVLVHNIRSLYNVGSIFRTSDAFGVSKLFLTGYTGAPTKFSSNLTKISKVALGAEKSVPWEYVDKPSKVIAKLKKEHPSLKVVGLENNLPPALKKKVKKISSFKPKFPLLLVLGEEVSGIPKDLLKKCDDFVEIPQHGEKESLNVSVAFGIAAYELGKWENTRKKI